MPAIAKICGLSTPETVRAALDGGAGYLGFVFFERSPRYLTPETAARLAEAARGKGVKVVAVLVDPDDALLESLRETLRPDLIQLHGRELPGRVREDWTLLSGRRFARPWFLAGGLDPWNVTEAIAASGAPMVDVSSGVERGAGLKDPGLISAFLDAVRRA